MKKCSKCKKDKATNEFSFKNKSLGTKQPQCKECTRLLIKNHYNGNRQYYLDKARIRNTKLRLDINSYLRNFLLKSSCVDCGESDIRVLEFDHKGEVEKYMAISSMARLRLPVEKIQEEIDKCEVRCSNCHRRRTANDFEWYKNDMRL